MTVGSEFEGVRPTPPGVGQRLEVRGSKKEARGFDPPDPPGKSNPVLTSVVHHPTTSFNPILIHSNTNPPFCHLVTQIFQSLHSRSCPASLEQTPASIATNI